jgi:hypothetical protein
MLFVKINAADWLVGGVISVAIVKRTFSWIEDWSIIMARPLG